MTDRLTLRLFVVALSLCLMLILPVSAVERTVLEDGADTYFSYNLEGRASVAERDKFLKISIADGSSVRRYETIYVKAEVKYVDNSAVNGAHAIIRERPSDYTNITLKYNGVVVANANVGYNTFFADDGRTIESIQWWIEHIEWLSSANIPAGYVQLTISDFPADFPLFNPYIYFIGSNDVGPTAEKPVLFGYYGNPSFVFGDYIVLGSLRWQNIVEVDKNLDEPFGYIRIIRDGHWSDVSISSDAGAYTDKSSRNITYRYTGSGNWSVISLTGRTFAGTFGSDVDPGDPGDPGDAILRTGTVSMTDHNGTTIRGFEVTAINAYTGENYTVSTETDVAVMTLPMDRTIRLRNPQTGEYEEVPIGYYRFYGQAPGYKMLNEDGIQVAVMPEEYTSYQLCIILVTPESGPLSGKHKFQIRSRADNSILQTGTVSAKSATTGEWYNTTVSGGIATLILPYDTSNSQSQYAGNYYVYATSPGYEDSDYGTQIVVMPHTVSETRIILLTPAGGIPTPGNVTLRIQVFSETGPGVVNAEIFISGVQGAGASVWDTYTASSTGYLSVSVPGNSTYDIVASGAGYYDSARRIEVFTDDPPLIEIKLYLSGAPTVEPTTQPTGWPTTQPTTQPPDGIPDEDDDSEGFLMQAVRGIGLAFGVGFATAKLIFGMLLALSIGYATAKQLRGGAAEFGLGLLGGTLLGVLIGLLPVWIIVVLLLVVGLYIGNRYVGGGSNNG